MPEPVYTIEEVGWATWDGGEQRWKGEFGRICIGSISLAQGVGASSFDCFTVGRHPRLGEPVSRGVARLEWNFGVGFLHYFHFADDGASAIGSERWITVLFC